MAKSKARPNSRAARREASPSINLDKSITSIKAPEDSVDYNPKVLGAQNGGISKKNSKRMTRSQRLRQEKGMERAERNMDVLESARQKSLIKAKRVDERRADWLELNDKVKKAVPVKIKKPARAVGHLSDDEEPADTMDQDDIPEGLKSSKHAAGVGVSEQMPGETSTSDPAVPTPTAPAATPAPVQKDNEDIDEIL